MSSLNVKFMIKKIVPIAIIGIVLLIAYNLIMQITNAVRSQERLSAQAETVYQLEAKNKQFKKKLLEIQSEQFIEEQARNKLGLSKEGETIVIIPEDTLKLVMGATASAQAERLPNWLGWWRVFW